MSEADKKDLPAAPELGQDAPRAAAQPLEITGTAVCPGAAFGHAQMLSEGDLEIPHFTIEKTQTRSEFTRLRAAVHTVDKELEELLNEISAEEDTPAEAKAFLELHRQLLNDESIITDTQDIIRERLINAEWALSLRLEDIRRSFEEIDDEYLADRIEDIAGHGVKTQVDGRTVLAGNARLMESEHIDYTAAEGAGTIVYVARNGQFLGSILISDEEKPTAGTAMQGLQAQGVRTVMLTGDAPTVAELVAKDLGIDEVHAGLLPADKVAWVEKLLAQKPEKKELAFVGDGINDAPVLMRADIGIAMGALGSDAAIEAADIVLMDDDPAKISLAMRISRKCMRIAYENIVFALAVKAVCLVLTALGITNMWWGVFADVGVMVLAVLNATRMLNTRNYQVSDK